MEKSKRTSGEAQLYRQSSLTVKAGEFQRLGPSSLTGGEFEGQGRRSLTVKAGIWKGKGKITYRKNWRIEKVRAK